MRRMRPSRLPWRCLDLFLELACLADRRRRLAFDDEDDLIVSREDVDLLGLVLGLAVAAA